MEWKFFLLSLTQERRKQKIIMVPRVKMSNLGSSNWNAFFRDNRKSTESSSSDDEESNPLNLKAGGPGRRAKHFSHSSPRKKKV